ncbi:trimeric intracellular cation channel family protein [Humidisolicoccus flavus]|uniref:trimeric intracellular cation channel family protein n=1 Tax=Humidisolicoccus flavus TaxID=3111414 RepID=UPI0032535DE8
MDWPWFGLANTIFVAIGVFTFSISGALLAVEKRMDVVGMLGLAAITAVGGGVIRDLLIGAPPVAFVDVWMIGMAMLGAVAVLFLNRVMQKLEKPVLVFDAVGLGIFCVQATIKAMEYGFNAWGAVLIGTITGIGGGILRDVLANDIPAVFRRESRLYLVPALVGAGLTALLVELGFGTPLALAPVAVLVVVVRLLSEAFDWRMPHPKTTLIQVVAEQSRNQR